MRPILGLLFLLLSPAYGDSFQFAAPTRIATASCTDFEWVSDVPLCLESAKLLRKVATEKFGVSDKMVHAWSNGSAEDFLRWLKTLEEKGSPDSTLILYFVTHQLTDGRLKFSKGEDLAGSVFVEAMNSLARHYDRIVLINDCCYGAAMEGCGKFYDNIVRLYAASEEEEADNLRFGKGPYGLEKFLKAERSWLVSALKWDPPGMSFLGVIGLKAGCELAGTGGAVDLQTFFRSLSAARNEYDESIRQKKVQHLILVPSMANFDILTRQEHER